MIGTSISHYRIVEKIGEGGMGQVFKAFDTRLNRHVAIKVLPAGRNEDPKRRERFLREARAASALNHPNIVTIYDILSQEDNEYLVMEYITGLTLGQMLAKGPMPVSQVVNTATQTADALATAHESNIVHRDLKPGNVMITSSNLVKLLDFGLAKQVTDPVTTDGDETLTIAEPLTVKNTIIGTPRYMSPEQAEGKKVDTRSDTFTFGVVLYEMITGRSAFHADSTLATLTLVLRDDPKPVADIVPDAPKEIVTIIQRCLKKDPDHRYQQMRMVHQELVALAAQLVATKTVVAVAAPAVEAKPAETPVEKPVEKVAAPEKPVAKEEAGAKKKAAAKAPAAAGAAVAGKPAAKSNNRFILVAGLTAVVALGAFIAYRTMSSQPQPEVAQQPAPTPPPVATPPPEPTPPPVTETPAQQAATAAATAAATKAGTVPPATKKNAAPVKGKEMVGLPAAPVSSPKPVPVVEEKAAAPVAVVAAPTPTALAPTTMAVPLKDGTPIVLVLSKPVSMEVDKGDAVFFEIGKDVLVDGNVVISKGAAVKATIVDGMKRRMLVRRTNITLLFESVTLVDGKHVQLRESVAGGRGPRKPRELGRVENKDKDIAVPAGVQYVAYTDGDASVTVRLH